MTVKKKVIIIMAAAVLLAAGLFIWKQVFPDEYQVGEDEIALYFTLDVREDVGLIVYDYRCDDHDYGGGVSNADRSMIRHDEVVICVFDRRDLDCQKEMVHLNMKLRIITEYVDPNFENIYPEEITRRLEEIAWDAEFGKAYTLLITGDNVKGYEVSLQQ